MAGFAPADDGARGAIDGDELVRGGRGGVRAITLNGKIQRIRQSTDGYIFPIGV